LKTTFGSSVSDGMSKLQTVHGTRHVDISEYYSDVGPFLKEFDCCQNAGFVPKPYDL